MLHRPKLAGQLSIWSIILLVYDIKYVPNNVIKAQPLANFMTEMTLVPEALEPTEPTVETWQIWTDGAYSVEGSGISIVL